MSAGRAILKIMKPVSAACWGRPISAPNEGWAVVDVETSGFRPGQARIISIAALGLDAAHLAGAAA